MDVQVLAATALCEMVEVALPFQGESSMLAAFLRGLGNFRGISHMASPAPPANAIHRLMVATDDPDGVDTILAMARSVGVLGASATTSPIDTVALTREFKPHLVILALTSLTPEWGSLIGTLYRDFNVPSCIITPVSQQPLTESATQAGVVGLIVAGSPEPAIAASLAIASASAACLREQRESIASLVQRLEDRKVIEKAKWIIIQKLKLDENEAMRHLQKQARDRRRALAEVAQSILDSADLFAPSPETAQRKLVRPR